MPLNIFNSTKNNEIIEKIKFKTKEMECNKVVKIAKVNYIISDKNVMFRFIIVNDEMQCTYMFMEKLHV